MLIKCPKCGFSQPKDKYCAQCGLDIENYRPPKPPLFSRLAQDPFVHLFLVLVVALGSGYYVYKNNRKEIQERVTFFRQGIEYARDASNPTGGSTEGTYGNTESEIPQEMLAGSETQTSAPQDLAPVNEVPPNAAATAAAADPNAPRGAGERKPQLQILYVEVASALLEQIYNDSRESGLFNSLGDHVAGIWPQGKKKVEGLQNWRVIDQESKAAEIGKPLQYFAGLKGSDPENDLGLTTYVEVTGVDVNGLHGQLEVVRSWREPNADGSVGIQRRFYPAQVDIPADGFFYIVGLLPRGTAMENDPYLTNIDPFKLLKNNFFKNRQTEFIFVVEYEK